MMEVFRQPLSLLAMAYGGMLAGLLLDLSRIPRRLFPGAVVTGIMDALFVLGAAAAFALSLLLATGGALRPYAALGFLAGFLLEQASLSWLFFRAFHRLLFRLRSR